MSEVQAKTSDSDVALDKLVHGEVLELLADVEAGTISSAQFKKALDRRWTNPWFRLRQFLRTVIEP